MGGEAVWLGRRLGSWRARTSLAPERSARDWCVHGPSQLTSPCGVRRKKGWPNEGRLRSMSKANNYILNQGLASKHRRYFELVFQLIISYTKISKENRCRTHG